MQHVHENWRFLDALRIVAPRAGLHLGDPNIGKVTHSCGFRVPALLGMYELHCWGYHPGV
jgi:hypothetical protein